MPWSPDETKRVRELENRINAVEQDLRELLSEKDRQRDQQAHEWRTMLDAAKQVLTSSFRGQLEPLRPLLEKLDVLDDLHREMQAARDERIARKARDELQAKQTADDAVEATRLEALRSHRIKVWTILTPIILAVLGAMGTAIHSQLSAPHPQPVDSAHH